MDDGTRRQKSNETVRQEMKVATVESELRHRRLKWWQSILTHPDDNKQVRAAMFGNTMYENEDGPAMENGIIIERPVNPWAKQIILDINELAEKTNEKTADEWIQDTGDEQFLWGLEFRRQIMESDTTIVREYKERENIQPIIQEEEKETCGEMWPDGTICDYKSNKNGMGPHKAKKHKKVIPMNQLIINNRCPACRACFKSVDITRKHAHKYE